VGDRDDRGLERFGEFDCTTRSRNRRPRSLWLIQIGEVIYGGVGSGLYGMPHAGDRRRIRGRTDDRTHAGVPRKKVEAYEIKMASIAVLVPCSPHFSEPPSAR